MYTVFGWPATAPSYDLTFHNSLTGLSSVVVTGYTDVQYPFPSSETNPGLLLVEPNFTYGQGKPYTFSINDAPSLSTLRWQIRDALNDTEIVEFVDVQYPTTPKWHDREIDTAVREAIKLFNRYCKRELILECTFEQIRPALFSTATVTHVSFYDSAERAYIQIPRFSRRGHRAVQQRYWDFQNGSLVLYGTYTTTTPFEIGLEAQYPVPMNDMQELLIPPEDWDILTIYAQGKCYLRLAGQSAALDRWKEEGKRNDNPVTPIAKILMADATQRMQDRRGPRAIKRYRA